MINKKDINQILLLLNINKIKRYELLSSSFDINCLKIELENTDELIIKYYNNKKKGFNAIESELKNLIFLKKRNLNFFPEIKLKNKDYLILEYINNDNKKPFITKKDLLTSIIKIHSIKHNQFGFDFNTQIGGLEKINTYKKNWVEFFRDQRLYFIFNLINKKNLIDLSFANKIEILLNKIDLMIPSNPQPCLLHGDLWEGNILFNNGKFSSFIDPGSFFGHNELEVAYLRWFNPSFIDADFLDKYRNFIEIHKDYLKYEPIYQLYYSLLNVYLWDKSYIKDSKNLLKKIKL